MHTWAHPEQSSRFEPHKPWHVAGVSAWPACRRPCRVGLSGTAGVCHEDPPAGCVSVCAHLCGCKGQYHKDLAPGRGPPQQLAVPLAFTSGPAGALRVQTKMSLPLPYLLHPTPTPVPVLTRTVSPGTLGKGCAGVRKEGSAREQQSLGSCGGGSGGPVKVRDEFCGVGASPGRPQDGRGVGVGPEDFPEEEGPHRPEEEGGLPTWGWGTAPGELVLVVLLGAGGQQGLREGASLRPKLMVSPMGPAALAAHLPGYRHWERGGTKRWGHLSPSGCGWGREGQTKRWGDAGGWPEDGGLRVALPARCGLG